MSLPIFGAQAAVSILNRVFTNSSPANAVFANQVTNATASLAAGANSTDVLSYTAFAKSFGTAYATQTPAALSTLMLSNMGLLPNAALQTALADYITAAGVANVGIVALQLSNILSSIPTTDVNYGAAARAWDAEVTSAFTYSSNTANTTPQNGDVVQPPATQGQTFTLTTSVDNIAGTTGDDTINATNSATSAVLGGLDVVDGGTGNDTLNVTDTAVAANAAFNLPTGFTVKNVESLNIVANGSLGGAANLDVSGMTGLTTLKATSAGDGTTNHMVKAATTTDVALTLGASAATTTVTGGKTVSITGAVTGAVTVNDAAATPNKGTTLTAVTLTNVDANSTVAGGALTTVTVGGATTAARTVTVDNATASHALTINAAGTGYKADGTTAVQTKVTDTVATSLTVNTTAKSSLDASGSSAVKAVTLTGSGALVFAAMGAAVTSIDGSAATGALTLGDLNAAAVTVKTGSGNDSLGIQATTKTAVDTGAGNDTVTLKSALFAGSTVNLGAGDDKFLFGTGGSVAVSTSTVIDAGDGTDSVSAQLLTAGNAAQFKNFELINLDSTTGFDVALLTGSTITGLTMSSASTTATYQNLTQAAGLTVDFVGNNSGVTNTLSFTGVSGTADSYAITFNAAAATTAAGSADVRAGTVVAAGIENFTIASGGTNHWNELTLGANTSAKTVTITGASNLDLTFAAGFGSTTSPQTGVSSVDGSAATGKLSINLTNVVSATAGLTVKGGSAADTITTSASATTLTGGAGADNFVVAAAVAGSTTAPVITTITDAAAGDKLTLIDKGTETFTTTKVDVSTATALFGGTVNALDLASTGDGSTNGIVKWFQYGGNTYVVQDVTAAATFAATDLVVKLTGLVDLSTATGAGTNVLTLA